jgi:RNA-directed DNA polymerase
MSGDVHVRFLEGAGVRFPRATHLVICCRGTADEAMTAMRKIMDKLKLTVNEEKTRRCQLPEETFDFLGYTVGRCYSRKTGRAYIGTRPSRKKIQSLCREMSEMTARRWTPLAPEEVVARINRTITGWANYFCLGSVSQAYAAVDRHVGYRLRHWLRRKHQVRGGIYTRYPDSYLYGELGLDRLAPRTRSFPWAKA